MTKKDLTPLKDMHYPANKPDVIANAVSEDIDENCVEKMLDDLPDDKTYHDFKDIKKSLSHDNQPND